MYLFKKKRGPYMPLGFSVTKMFYFSGAIFKPGDDQAKTAFRYAQSKYNSRSTNPFALASYIDDIDVADSFTLASRSKLFLLCFSTLSTQTNVTHYHLVLAS